MPQPVTALSASASTTTDSSSFANRPRESTGSFQYTLDRVQGDQTTGASTANSTPVQPNVVKKPAKDNEHKTASATPAKQNDANQKIQKTASKPNGKSDSSGRQDQPKQQSKQQEPPQIQQPQAVNVEPVVVAPHPQEPVQASAVPANSPQAAGHLTKAVAKAIPQTTGATKADPAPAAAPDAQPPDASQPQTTPSDPQNGQPTQSTAPQQSIPPQPDSPAAADSEATSGPAAKQAKAVKQASARPAPSSDSPVPDATAGAASAAQPTDAPDAPKSTPDEILAKIGLPDSVIQLHTQAADAQAKAAASAKPAPLPLEAQFAELNHPTLVEAIHGQLLPDGGKMTIRLDPPELGALNVHVEVRDGVINASFEASSDQTVKLLSHSLGDLKTALEAQGVSVEKLHVSQAPKDHSASQNDNRRESDRGTQDRSAQQEQQRREMMRRMWRRLMKGQDPLDLVA